MGGGTEIGTGGGAGGYTGGAYLRYKGRLKSASLLPSTILKRNK